MAKILAWPRDSTEPSGDGVKSPASTDSVIEGTLVHNKPGLETITGVDRVPRLLRQDKVVKAPKLTKADLEYLAKTCLPD